MSYFEEDGCEPFDPNAVFTRCVESGHASLLLDHEALPAEFFDLSSGVAGELLHKLTTYRIRLAGVVPDPGIHSERFQEFMGEANRRDDYRFFSTREEAVAWLDSGS